MAEQETQVAAHTALPWTADGTYIVGADGFTVGSLEEVFGLLPHWGEKGYSHWCDVEGESYIQRFEEEAEANTALVVRAVNAHEALVDAAQKAIEALELWPETDWGWREREVYDLLCAALDKVYR